MSILIVGVLSDTHDSLANTEKAIKVFRDNNVSMIIHLGDIIAPFTLRAILEGLNVRFEGVFGNNDGEKLGLLRIASIYNASLGEQPRVVNINGRRLLLVHGFGDPVTTYEIVKALAESGRWNAVLYGHTHEPLVDYVRGSLILNPGDCSGVLNKPTVALLDTRTLRVRLVNLE
ncbi:MAG: metallophosphoesterase [Acidilobaceae archaeon]